MDVHEKLKFLKSELRITNKDGELFQMIIGITGEGGYAHFRLIWPCIWGGMAVMANWLYKKV